MTDFLNTYFYGFDTRVYELVCGVQNEFLNVVANIFANFGNIRAFLVYVVIALVLCCFKKTRKYGISLAFALAIGSLITNMILKPWIARPRPYVGLKDTPFWNTYEAFYTYAGSHLEGDKSFPSGHTTVAFESSVSLFSTARSDGHKWAYILLVLAVIMGLSRIYLCVHYPTDVIAGFLVGTLAGVGVFLISRQITSAAEKRKLLKDKV